MAMPSDAAGPPASGGGRPARVPSAAPAAPAAPGGPQKVVRFYHDVMAEMKRVTWPDRKTLTDSTIRIIIFVLFLGALIALVDIGLQFFLVRLPALLLGR